MMLMISIDRGQRAGGAAAESKPGEPQLYVIWSGNCLVLVWLKSKTQQGEVFIIDNANVYQAWRAAA